jgi:tetraacyldisaccharide 4'-kinase
VTLLRALLWPFSVVYEAVVRLRAWCYRKAIFRQRRLGGVVISVGNLTVGGTGKTPMVLWISERLLTEGRRVGVLTRGYQGLFKFSSHWAPAAQIRDHRPDVVGSDEVWLLLRRVQQLGPECAARFMIGVGANRYAQGRRLEAQGIEGFVLDDGFQHLKLARNVDIVLIDATDPLGGGRLLPAGRLREPKSALGRADVVVITRSDHAPAVEAMIRRDTAAPIFYASPEMDGIFRIAGKVVGPPEPDWRWKKLFAFCGIGNPAAFFDDLRRWGLQIVGNAAYRDHHRYSQRDAWELERKASASGAEALLSTEKDALNFSNARFQDFPVCYCRISLRIADAESFWNAVTTIARERRPGIPL